MAKINGIAGMTGTQLQTAIQQGGKFVVYEYCISILILTFKRGSAIYFIQPGENAILKGLPYLLISLILGWWGIPWGPIYTITSTITNLGGGKNVTPQVLASLTSAARAAQPTA